MFSYIAIDSRTVIRARRGRSRGIVPMARREPVEDVPLERAGRRDLEVVDHRVCERLGRMPGRSPARRPSHPAIARIAIGRSRTGGSTPPHRSPRFGRRRSGRGVRSRSDPDHANGRAWLPWSSGRGRSDVPMRYSSIEWAACRPSAIAQTIRLWPRVMSPAVKTLATLVRSIGVRLDVAHGVELDAELLEHPLALGAGEAHGQQDELRPGRSSPCRGSRRTASGRCRSSSRRGPSRAPGRGRARRPGSAGC